DKAIIDVGMLPMAERLNVVRVLHRALPAKSGEAAAASPPAGVPPLSYWWESAPTQAGATSELLGEVPARLVRNGGLGFLIIISAPAPLALLIAGVLAHKEGDTSFPLLVDAFYAELFSGGLALVGIYRLVRARAALLRAGLLGLNVLLIALQVLSKSTSA